MSRGHTLVRGTQSPYFQRPENFATSSSNSSSLATATAPHGIYTVESFNNTFQSRTERKFYTYNDRILKPKPVKSTTFKPKVINKIHISELSKPQLNYYINLAKNPRTKSCKKLGIPPQTMDWGPASEYWTEAHDERHAISRWVDDSYTFMEFMEDAQIHTVWDGSSWTAHILTLPDGDAPSQWTSMSHPEYEVAAALTYIKKYHGEEVEDV